MKKLLFVFAALLTVSSGCSTVQSLLGSTFPYTANLIVPASNRTNATMSATSSASSFSQIFGQSTTANVREVRIASARIEAVNPANQELGVFRSIRLYVARTDGSSEILVAQRDDVSASTGNSINLDIDSSRFLDEYLQGGSVRVRMEYVLRSTLNADVSLRASLSFSSTPVTR